MRTKNLLILMLLTLFGSLSVQARSVAYDATKSGNFFSYNFAGCTATFDAATKTLSWTGNLSITGFQNIGDLSEYESVIIDVAAVDAETPIPADLTADLEKDNGGKTSKKVTLVEGENKLVLADIIDAETTLTQADLASVQSIGLASAAAEGKVVIKAIYFENSLPDLAPEPEENAVRKEANLGGLEEVTEGKSYTYNPITHAYTWSAPWGNLMDIKDLPYYDEAKKFTNYYIKVSYVQPYDEANSYARLCINDGTELITHKLIEGVNVIPVPADADVKQIRIGGAGGSGAVIFHYFYTEVIEAPSIKGNDIAGFPLTPEMYNESTFLKLNEETDHFFGTGSADNPNAYVDLSKYLYLKYTMGKGEPRLFVFGKDMEKADVLKGTDSKYVTAEGNTYTFDIQKYVADKGFAHLGTIKSSGYGVKDTLKDVQILDHQDVIYNLYGKGELTEELIEEMMDVPYAIIDATGLQVTEPIEIPVANPNTIILANEGQVSNETNVVVNGECAELMLMGGMPFKAPADFTAKAVTFVNSMAAPLEGEEVANEAWNIYALPFTAPVPEGVNAYVFDEAKAAKGIIYLQAIDTIVANKPFILNHSGFFQLTAEDAKIVASENITTNGALTASYSFTDTIPTGAYFINSGYNGTAFVQVTDDDQPFLLYAFNGYLTLTEGADSIASYALATEKPFIHGYANSVEELTAAMFKDYTDKENPAVAYPAYELNKATGMPYGDGNVGMNNYADLSAYKYLGITVSEGQPRCCINRLTADGQDNEDPAQAKMLDFNKEWTIAKYQTKVGNTYWIDLGKIVEDFGFAYLHCIKGANWANVNVTALNLTDAKSFADCVLVGEGDYAEDVYSLVDSAYNSIDVTGVTEEGQLELYPQNTNAMILANKGQVANEANVIVNDTCQSLQLIVGQPFVAPVPFVASEAALYVTLRNMHGNAVEEEGADTPAEEEGVAVKPNWAMVTVPFNAAVPEGVDAYAINTISAKGYVKLDTLSEIKANVPVIINFIGAAQIVGTTQAIAPSAQAIAGGLTASYTGVEAPAESYLFGVNEEGKVGFAKATEAVELTPFFAYLTVTGEAAANEFLIIGSEPTGISEVNNAKANATLVRFNMAGQQIKASAKGMQIQRMANGTVRKVMKK